MTTTGHPRKPLRIGIDVGGTHTDAVALDTDDRILAHTKQPTSPDITGGVRAAVDAVLGLLGPDDARNVRQVMLGTTHATNAVVERRNLARVAVIRIGRRITSAVPPLTAWPADLREAAVAGTVMVDGGYLVDGHQVAPVDRDEVRRFLHQVADRAQAVAVTGAFAPMYPDQEQLVAELVRAELGTGTPVSLSHELGSLSLLERENATTLNAALGPVGAQVADALDQALRDHGLDVAGYLAQSDGTLMEAAHARRFPVLTIGSGPSNSLRGAALLTGHQDAIVIDVGGTTTDLGVLVDGFARESAAGSLIGGVTTSLAMPDVLSLGYGGGTVIHPDRVGPESVGHAIRRHGLVFGGTTPTLTDAAVHAGRSTTGTRSQLLDRPTEPFRRAITAFDDDLAHAVALVSHGRRDQPVIAVGGGADLLPDTIAGRTVQRPGHGGVANAAGAAIALISGEYETLIPAGSGRGEALARARTEALTRATAAGAAPEHTTIVRIREVPVSYAGQPALRVTVKAAGRLRTG
ncbi:hydantoinase/oxoprolinase N-terminal domain-containing protein [Kitasatospora herbaricolor]|uniref:hydantoinase/oxoprolinase N-terminal domain-containing protein n=1 Tax=Kitasatospora herbaricolor TaxID=68217 RepID=UPI0036DE489D